MLHFGLWQRLAQWCVELTELVQSKRVNSRSKSRTLGFLFILIIVAFILAGQSWFLVLMSPNDEIVTLKNFDGFTAYAWLSSMLLVCLATAAVASLLSGFSSRAVFGFGFLVSALMTFMVASSVIVQDLGGVSKELESATGIAATHGLSGLQIETSQAAYLSLISLGLVSAGFLYAMFTQKSWTSNSSRTKLKAAKSRPTGKGKSSSPAKAKQSPKDSIAIWDEQR